MVGMVSPLFSMPRPYLKNPLFLSSFWGPPQGQNIKYLPYAFTEHGVAMLASVLRSDRAAEMNILIVRAFVKLREILATHTDLARAIEDMGRRLDKHDQQIEAIIEIINRLLAPEPVPPARRIGFNAGDGSETAAE
jgi:hypothetical protein